MKTFFLFIALFFSSNTLLVAQESILKTIGGAAKKKVEQQDFNTTRSNKEKGMLNDDRKKSAPAPAPSSPPSKSTESSPSDTVPVVTPEPTTPAEKGKYKDEYTFLQTVTYETVELDSKKQDKTKTSYSINNSTILSQSEDGKTTTIFDFENETMLTIDEKNKTATALSTKWATNMAANQMKKNEEKYGVATITKTGNTKKILGYDCVEYEVKDNENRYLNWITTDIKADYSKIMGSLNKSANVKNASNELNNQGVTMEVTTFNKKGEPATRMTMIEYKVETIVKKLSDYQVTSF